MSREPFGVRPRSVDEAVAIIERLLGTMADQQERITALDTRIAEQRAEITALRAHVAALTERLGQSSRNSSRPPSTDPRSAPGRPAGPRGPGPRAVVSRLVWKREMAHSS